MIKILTILGTRPEVIKLAPVIHRLKENNKFFITKVCSTGQHIEMIKSAIDYFEIEVDFDLKLMSPNQNLSQLTSRLLKSLPKIINSFNPNIILVQGDTTTAFAAGLISYYHKIKVGHIEAGLRTNNKYSPYPEEINRRMLGILSDYHFAPTEKAKKNLMKEGVDVSRIFVTGNTVIDALYFTIRKIKDAIPKIEQLENVFQNNRKKVLITGHRRENFGESFRNICEAIKSLAVMFEKVDFIYPVHLNPNVQKPVNDILKGIDNIYLLPPLGYVPFVRLMEASYLILTDSGGIQEEAPSLGKPVLVMREITERPEGVEVGSALLVGTDKEKIIKTTSDLLTDYSKWKKMSEVKNPYGDGKASMRIVNHLKNLL